MKLHEMKRFNFLPHVITTKLIRQSFISITKTTLQPWSSECRIFWN